jgi:hypothetical protein
MPRSSLDAKVINPDYFVGKFHADAFLVSLLKDALGQYTPSSAARGPGVAVTAADQDAAKQSLDRIQRLLRVLERWAAAGDPWANPPWVHQQEVGGQL